MTSTEREQRDLFERPPTVEVYQGFESQLVPAPLLKRFLAFCTDYGLLMIVYYISILVLGLLSFFFIFGLKPLFNVESLVAGAVGISLILFLLLISLSSFVYFVYGEYKLAPTPGKRIFGLRVVTIDGSPLTVKKLVLRELGRYVDYLMVPALVSIALTQRRQRVGDLLSGCCVVYLKSQAEEDFFEFVKSSDYYYLIELLQPQNQVEPDIRQAFLEFARRELLSGDVGQKLQSGEFKSFESLARGYFLSEAHQRLDRLSALLFFAEHCQQLNRQVNKQPADGRP